MTRDTDDEMAKALDSALAKGLDLLDAESTPERVFLLPFDSAILLRLFTPERMRLLSTVNEDGPFESVNELAEKLGRDQSRVSRDLQELETMGLLEIVREGRSKRIAAYSTDIVLRIPGPARGRKSEPLQTLIEPSPASEPFILVMETVETTREPDGVLVAGYEISPGSGTLVMSNSRVDDHERVRRRIPKDALQPTG